MENPPTRVDLIVIGGGRAANLAAAAGREGWRTVLLEKDRLGGTCPNRGCVPSKLLIGFSEAAQAVRGAERHFLRARLEGVDAEAMFASVNDYVEGVDGRYAGRLPDTVTLERGVGRFSGPREVEVNGRRYRAEKIVLATGARPAPPPALWRDLPVWTSDNLFPLQEPVPRSLLVIGGGFIGAEMASFFAGIGVEVTLAARGDRLLPREDGQVEAVFRAEFARGVRTHLGAELKELRREGDGFRAVLQTAAGPVAMEVDRVLFAIGRLPNSEELNLAATGLAADARGFVPVNNHLETAIPGIYAAGDINGRHMLQHAASYEIHYLRRKLLKGASGPLETDAMPHAVFAHPEVAAVGATEEELKAAGTPYVAVFEDWLASARAMSWRVTYPRTKLLVSPRDYRILGCHLVGPESATLMHQVMTVMRLKNDVRELAEMIYIHPALNECLLAAAVKAAGAVRQARGE